jgi:hypothetical protein
VLRACGNGGNDLAHWNHLQHLAKRRHPSRRRSRSH